VARKAPGKKREGRDFMLVDSVKGVGDTAG